MLYKSECVMHRNVTWFWAVSLNFKHGDSAWCRNEGVREHFMNFRQTKIFTLDKLYDKLIIPAPWASIFPKLTSQHLPFESFFFVEHGLLPRHLKLQNDGTRKHLKFGGFAKTAELGKNEGFWGVSSVYLQGPVSRYVGWVHPLGVLCFTLLG